MKKGDIVLVPFPFTDLTGNKNRPAVILIESENDVTVCFVSTRLKWKSEFDIVIQPTELNGLKKSSIIRLSKLATIDKELIIGRLGELDINQTDLLNKNLIRLLKLDLK
jgi:mRNA interferase MazF